MISISVIFPECSVDTGNIFTVKFKLNREIRVRVRPSEPVRVVVQKGLENVDFVGRFQSRDVGRLVFVVISSEPVGAGTADGRATVETDPRGKLS